MGDLDNWDDGDMQDIPEPPASFCSQCLEVFSPDGLRQALVLEGFFHSEMDAQGRLQYKSECALCRVIDKSLNSERRDRPSSDLDMRGHISVAALGAGGTRRSRCAPRWSLDDGHDMPVHNLEISCISESGKPGYPGPGRHRETWKFIPVAAHGSPAAKFFARRPPEPPSSQASFFTAARWLSTCAWKHEACSRVLSAPLPTRVVDVTASADTVRLYLPAASQEGEYACLSYCWGGPQDVVLTVASMSRLRAGVPVRELGQTIQDAVQVTRRLRLRYLWVDALCIIQDSDADKDVELARMSDIYSRAAVTIAAAEAVASTAGFLQPGAAERRSYNLEPIDIPFQKGGTVRLYSDTGNRAEKLLQGFHLNTRAWTMQEMLLSPRVLFYTAAEVVWLCEETGAQTVYPSRYTYNINFSDRTTWREILRQARNKEPFWQDWLRLIKFYTSRNMTLPDDRLRAMQALVDTVERISGYRCLYGLWEPWLPYMLTWHVVGNLGPRRASHRSPLGAPTWSWASVVDRVGIFIISRADAGVFAVREDHALGLEGVVIPAAGVRALFPEREGTDSKRRYFADLWTPPESRRREDKVYLCLYASRQSWGTVGLIEMEPVDGGDFVRTGFVLYHRTVPQEELNRFETRRIWLR